MALQLLRCVQQLFLLRAWSMVGGPISTPHVCNLMAHSTTVTPVPRSLIRAQSSQSLLIMLRSCSSCRIVRFGGISSVGRLRVTFSTISRNVQGNFADGFQVSDLGMRTSHSLPLLSSFLTRCLSSVEAPDCGDSILKESLVKEAEEMLGIFSLSNPERELTEVGEEAGAPSAGLLTPEENETDFLASEQDILVADIKSKELELAELLSALRVVENKRRLVLLASGSDSVSFAGFPEILYADDHSASSQVSPPVCKSAAFSIGEPSRTPLCMDEVAGPSSQEDNGAFIRQAGKDDLLGSETSAGPESSRHLWPEWMHFLKLLDEGGHLVNEEKMVDDLIGSTNCDFGLIKRACLTFARERDDIFLHYSRKDLEVIARFGCPCTDRKVVNAGKRLRDFLAIDEISVCKPCALRGSCERRDFKASAHHVCGTPEVIRLLSQYALEVSPYAKEGLQIPSAVRTACTNLLKETIGSVAFPRDHSVPKSERKLEAVKSERRERERTRHSRDADAEMKPGDWKCEKCEYVNFARNRTCRECDAFCPVPDMRPGDWRCPECNFVNFSRNRECHDCNLDRPTGSRHSSSFDMESRYGGGKPEGRENRFYRPRRFEIQSHGRQSQRSSFGLPDGRDNERDSDYFDKQGASHETFRWSQERVGLEHLSGGAEAQSTQRSTLKEWKPDFEREKFGKEEHKDRRSTLDIVDDRGTRDSESVSDNEEATSDVEPLGFEEFEYEGPIAAVSRGRSDTGRGRKVRSRIRDCNAGKQISWELDRSFISGRGNRGSRGGGCISRGGYQADRRNFDRDGDNFRDLWPSSFERLNRSSNRSHNSIERDSGRSDGRFYKNVGRSFKGRGGGRGGDKENGRGR